MQHAFEQQRQVGLALQPGDVIPGWGLLQQAIEQGTGPGRLHHGWGRQVDGPHVGRQLKTGTSFAVAGAGAGGVHRQHQGLVTGLLGSGHEFACSAAVGLEVELEPEWAAAGFRQKGRGHLFKACAGLGAQHHAGLQGRSGLGCGNFSAGMGQGLVGHGRQQDGVGQGAPEQLHLGMPAGQRLQHPRQQQLLVPGLMIGAQAQFVGSTTAEIGPGLLVEVCARSGFVISQGDQACKGAVARSWGVHA